MLRIRITGVERKETSARDVILLTFWGGYVYFCIDKEQTYGQGGRTMLVLSRNIGEEIVIAGNIRVCVVAVEGGRVRLGVEAPRSVSVDRKEVHLQRAGFMERTSTAARSLLAVP
jgi:carbon storage regulator CsrA